MKRISMVAIAAFAAACALGADSTKKALAAEGKSWTLNLGFAMPRGDHDDGGVDSMFMLGVDYGLGATGGTSQGSTYVGVGWMSGEGDGDFESRSYGIHYGGMFGLGSGDSMPLMVKLQGGYYNTRLEAFGDEADRWGFGGVIALVWMPKSSGGPNFSVEGGMYFMPSVEGVNNNGWYLSVGIPIGGK